MTRLIIYIHFSICSVGPRGKLTQSAASRSWQSYQGEEIYDTFITIANPYLKTGQQLPACCLPLVDVIIRQSILIGCSVLSAHCYWLLTLKPAVPREKLEGPVLYSDFSATVTSSSATANRKWRNLNTACWS